MSTTDDALKAGRLGSIARRPATASAFGAPAAVSRQHDGRARLANAARIQIDRIIADPDQPRKSFGGDADDRLAQSMDQRGQFVPVLVRWDAEADRYIIIDGERRYRAAIKAKLADLACVVEDEADPDTILEVQLITNALREDVKPVEQAKAWERLRASQNLSLRELGEKLGYDFSSVSKSLDLLRLSPEIQARVDAGEIPASTAGLIARVDDHAEQEALAVRAVDGEMNRAEVAAMVKRTTAARPKPGGKAKGRGAKLKPVTSRVFRFDGGLKITAERARGLDLLALVEAMRTTAEAIEAGFRAEAGPAE